MSSTLCQSLDPVGMAKLATEICLAGNAHAPFPWQLFPLYKSQQQLHSTLATTHPTI